MKLDLWMNAAGDLQALEAVTPGFPQRIYYLPVAANGELRIVEEGVRKLRQGTFVVTYDAPYKRTETEQIKSILLALTDVVDRHVYGDDLSTSFKPEFRMAVNAMLAFRSAPATPELPQSLDLLLGPTPPSPYQWELP